MVLNFLKSSTPPIAIDFGYSELKVLQLTADEPLQVIAAARAVIPEMARSDIALRQEFLNERLPQIIREGGFEGRAAICSIPTWQTFVQHMRVRKSENADLNDQLIEQLQNMIVCDPTNVVIRHVEVCDVPNGESVGTEVICFAVARDVVMWQIELLKRCKLEVGGLHAEPVAANEAFKRLYRRDGDDQITTAYVDAGTSCANVMIAHGGRLVFSKSVPFGGRHFDQRIAEALRCDVADAMKQRLEFVRAHPVLPMQNRANATLAPGSSMKSGTASASATGTGGTSAAHKAGGPSTATDERRLGRLPDELATVSAGGTHQNPAMPEASSFEGSQAVVCECLKDMYGHLADELQMCSRYHAHLFPERPIDRLFLMGGESRSLGLCLALAEALQVPTYLADPLRRFQSSRQTTFVGLESLENQHGWAVPAGLCTCPMEF